MRGGNGECGRGGEGGGGGGEEGVLLFNTISSRLDLLLVQYYFVYTCNLRLFFMYIVITDFLFLHYCTVIMFCLLLHSKCINKHLKNQY